MTTTEKQTPPECCPICGAGIHETDDNAAGQIDRVWLGCGATWAMYRDGSTGWKEQCPHAMTACLRCGATLHPTAREQATAALVAACVELKLADRALDAANEDRTVLDDAWEVIFDASRVAQEKYDAAATAYLATVTP